MNRLAGARVLLSNIQPRQRIMTTLKEQAFKNVLNSPFSLPNPDRSENAGLDVILMFLAELRNPGTHGHRTAAGSIFADLFGTANTYDPARRQEMLLHFEAYLARINIFEEMLRAEALVRYFVKSIDETSPVKTYSGFADLHSEQVNPMLGMVKFLEARVAADVLHGTTLEKANAPVLGRLLERLEKDFIEPIVNFRHRIAHGYSRAFDKGLRRNGKDKNSDALATKLFEQADFRLATCIKSNLDALTLIFNHLPIFLSRIGSFYTDEIKGNVALFHHTPFIVLPGWQLTMAADVASIGDAGVKAFIEAPANALRDFWSTLRVS